ncbi:hypothetical protein OIE75_29770 [Streptomyces sp. NBC_01723]|uniref:hypothetical protein n=1 Tax=Streptomyces sp. NBC_01723 TaxID=2975921 RepID=UPI002E370283|nr:hypothetical protein [Streptomyces sp. NBC_01723]
MAEGIFSFELAGLGSEPTPENALHYGRLLAQRGEARVPDDAQPVITRVADDPDWWRIELPYTT